MLSLAKTLDQEKVTIWYPREFGQNLRSRKSYYLVSPRVLAKTLDQEKVTIWYPREFWPKPHQEKVTIWYPRELPKP